MSWGYKITIAYGLFIAMILGMVYIASQQTNEMQDKNYYARELVYQEIIDGKNNLNSATQKVTLTEESGNVVIHIPSVLSKELTEGIVYFLCPSNEKNDLKEALRLNDKSEHIILKSRLAKSYYSVKISWKNKDIPYYFEQTYSVD